MKPSGLCLLKRQEYKVAVPYKKLSKFFKILLNEKGFKREYFGNAKTIELHNVVFDIPSAKEMDIYFRKSYSRARVRTYHLKNYVSHYWGEYRFKAKDFVCKKRRILKTAKQLEAFLIEVAKKGLVFNNFSSYQRQSFNNKKEGIRITIDKNIIYLNNKFEPYTDKVFSDPKTAIIKFKFAKKLPDAFVFWKKFIEGLL